ncbi:MAG: TraB/GumN family protein, partial [Pseudomonadota bacterium]
ALKAFGQLTRDQLIAALVATDTWVAMEEDIFRTHTQLYRDGQIQAINEFGIWLAERENPPVDIRALNAKLLTGLLDDRNRAWMGRISQELAKGNVFIAVGALHLPGEAGLVSLIRQAGYQVERIEIRSP